MRNGNPEKMLQPQLQSIKILLEGAHRGEVKPGRAPSIIFREGSK